MKLRSLALSLLTLAAAPLSLTAATQSVLVAGLTNPARLIVSTGGNLLVTEAGDGSLNTALLSRVSQTGTHVVLLSGLPTAPAPDNVTGPWQIAQKDAKTLYISIGTGDTTVLDGQGAEVPNPSGPSSPLFSSILQVRFSRSVDQSAGGFALTYADHKTLSNGYEVTLHNAANETATFSVLSDFRDIIRDESGAARRSNPFGLALGSNTIYTADASRNDLQAVDLQTGRARQIVQFAPVANPLPFGPATLEPVPTGVAAYRGSLLVSLETGFPFPAGASSIKRVDPTTGCVSNFISGLTEAIDVIVSPATGQEKFYVIELSTDLLNGAPGRLLKFDSPTATPIVLSDSLIFPSSVARDPNTGNLFVTQFFTGEIVKIVP
jgi:hypothetical protein